MALGRVETSTDWAPRGPREHQAMSWRDGVGQNSTFQGAWQSLTGPMWAPCQALRTPSLSW